MTKLAGLVLVAVIGAFGVGCSDAPKASAACGASSAATNSGDACSACCSEHKANGHKYINGACSCLNGE